MNLLKIAQSTDAENRAFKLFYIHYKSDIDALKSDLWYNLNLENKKIKEYFPKVLEEKIFPLIISFFNFFKNNYEKLKIPTEEIKNKKKEILAGIDKFFTTQVEPLITWSRTQEDNITSLRCIDLYDIAKARISTFIDNLESNNQTSKTSFYKLDVDELFSLYVNLVGS